MGSFSILIIEINSVKKRIINFCSFKISNVYYDVNIGPKLSGMLFADIKLTQFAPVTVTIKAGNF